MRLRTRVMGILIILAVLPLTGLLTYSYDQGRSALEQATVQGLEGIAESQSERLAMLVRMHGERADLVASRTALRTTLAAELDSPDEANIERLTRIMDDAAASVEGLTGLHIVHAERGLIAGTTAGPAVGDWRNHSAFVGALDQQVRDVIVQDDNGISRWFVGTPLFLDGQFLAVLISTNHIGPVLELAIDYSGLGESGETLILQRSGVGFLVLNPLRFSPGSSFEKAVTDPDQAEAMAVNRGQSLVGLDYRGEQVIAIGRDVAGTDLSVVVKMDHAEAFAVTDKLLAAVVVFALAMVVVAIGMSVLLSRAVTAPIKRLSDRAIAIGKEHNAPPITTNDELVILTESVEGMASALLEEGRQLETRVAERTAELSEARQQADAANRAKSTFLASMSHEIRTPMNAVIGLTDVLLGLPLDDTEKEHVSGIKASSMHLLQLINQVLDFSKIEAGKMILATKPISPKQVVDQAIHIVEPVAALAGTELVTQFEPDVPLWIEGDAGRLRQVLVNLTTNAVKATPDGKVTIKAWVDEMLHLSVEDNGVGISAADQQRLFEAFEQVTTAGTPREGTGLGLAITQKIVNAMGGRISVASEPGEGAKFTVSIPFTVCDAPDDAAAVAPRESTPVTKQRVLVADDKAANRNVAKLLIEALGHEVVTVPDGEDVLDQLAEREFDFLLVDLEMERLHGLGVAQRLRSHERRKQMRLYAFTAHVGDHVEKAALASGMDGVLTKPITKDVLADLLGDVSNSGRTEIELDADFLQDIKLDVADGMAAIRLAVEGNDPGAAAKALHGIKGVALTVGWQQPANLAIALEDACREGNLPTDEQLHELQAAFDELAQAAG